LYATVHFAPPLADGEALGDFDGLGDTDFDGLGEAEGDGEGDGDGDAERDGETEGDGDAERDGETEGDGDGLPGYDRPKPYGNRPVCPSPELIGSWVALAGQVTGSLPVGL
jgi:hypothetical protein